MKLSAIIIKCNRFSAAGKASRSLVDGRLQLSGAFGARGRCGDSVWVLRRQRAIQDMRMLGVLRRGRLGPRLYF